MVRRRGRFNSDGRKCQGCTIIKFKEREIKIPHIYYFPGYFVEFVKDLETEMMETVKGTFNYLRWTNLGIPQEIHISYRSFTFSMNGTEWFPVPSRGLGVSVGEAFTPLIKIEKDNVAVIRDLIINDVQEPISYSLLREALVLKHSNPRASFIIAISAIEIAVKSLIAKILPQSEWLLENIPSPPIFKIMKEYFPLLPSNGTTDGSPFIIPKAMLKKLQKWIETRNLVVHKGSDAIVGDELSNMLLCIKDMLHIIDFNCGHIWAVKFIRKETVQESGFNLSNIRKM
jgi:hypothetical protein